jgi:hypothetical protein
MEEKNSLINPETSKKINWPIIISLIVIVIVVAVLLYVDYKKTENNAPNPPISGEEYKPEPISRDDNPRREEIIKDSSKYGCAGPDTINPAITKEADKTWTILKDGTTKIVSLGKYKIKNQANMTLDVPKLWLYFVSEKLSDRDDKVYSLEKSYVSKMTLVVNGYEREIKLGGSEYMLIELDNYPLGDIYPYDKETYLEFEVLVELKCDNLQGGECLGNNNNSLKFLDGADISPVFRIFAVGCQEFSNDIIFNAKFSY